MNKYSVLLVSPTSSFIFNEKLLDDCCEYQSSDPYKNSMELGVDQWAGHVEFTSLPRYSPNYGLLSLISFLRNNFQGLYDFKYVDLFAAGVSSARSCQIERVENMGEGKVLVRMGAQSDFLAQLVQEYAPRVVGLTCFTSAHHHDVVHAANVIRSAGKKLPVEPIIVVGGMHPTFLDEYFSAHESFDVVVRGEGELTFAELLSCVFKGQPLDQVSGITFKKNGRIIRNPNRPLMTREEIRSLPWIARDAIPRINGEEISSVYGMWHQGLLDGRPKVADFMAGRGCITKSDQCKHCVSGHIYGELRRRDTNDLIREMRYLVDEGYSIVSDITDQVLFPLRDFKEFCKGMTVEGIGEQLELWTPNGLFLDGIYRLNPEEKKQMVLAGYRDLCFSIEGGPRYVREVLNKPIDVLPIVEHLKQFRAIGIELQKRIIMRGFFMVGGPGCNNEIMNESYLFAEMLVKKGLLDQVIPFIACPIPGSEFFLDAIEQMRQVALGNNGTDRFRKLLFNGRVEKIPYWKSILIDGRLNDLYRFFEENYIWARLRYGLPDLHILYGMESENIYSIVNRMSNLTPAMSLIA